MSKKIRRDPEEEARWAELRRKGEELLARRERQMLEARKREARREQRLRRLTFGLLPR